MKKTKKLLLAVLGLLVSVSTYGFIGCNVTGGYKEPSADEEVMEMLNFHYLGNGTYGVEVDPFEAGYLEELSIPSKYNGKPVAKLVSCKYLPELKTVMLPSSIEIIGGNAFTNCTKLEVVTMSSNVSSIEDSAFRGCKKLEKIVFGGTKKQWEKIEKGSNWNDGVSTLTIQCKDGNITLGEETNKDSGGNKDSSGENNGWTPNF